MTNKLFPSTLTLAAATLVACSGGGHTDGSGNTRFFLPTGEDVRNTVNPTIETDAQGNLHMIYPTYAVGDAFYAFCDADCLSPDDVKVVRFPTEGTVYNAMLALDASGKPQVLLSSYQRLYYATCTGDCTEQSGWRVDVILSHTDDKEVTGEAFAVTPDGKPRFIMHSYRALFGLGAPPPATWYVTCDSDCTSASSWTQHKLADQIWQESSLRIGQDGRPRLATIATVTGESGSFDLGAYQECTGDCTQPGGWEGPGLMNAFSNRTVELIDPAISMEVSPQGVVHLTMLGLDGQNERTLAYFSCKSDCAAAGSWAATGLIIDSRLGAGVDLALTPAGGVRVVYTAASNIFLAHCDADTCSSDDSPWDLAKVELGSEMDPDQIIYRQNCTVAAWFLRHPSIAIGKDGMPRVVYRAEDISGGVKNPDPTKPRCHAGVDLTWARFANLQSLSLD